MKLLIVIDVVLVVLLLVVLNYLYGVPGYYIHKAWSDYHYSKLPHVVETRFYAEGELICVRIGQANIQIDRDVLLTRETIWSDGVKETACDSHWIGRTYGAWQR